ncbi:MAG: acyl-CoA thioesterase [bacterium]
MPSLMDSYVESSQFVQPNDTNAMNVAHGGNVVKWMDEIGGLAAMRFSGEICVTAGMDRVDFHHPIKLGNSANIEAYVFRTGTTSLSVFIRVSAEDLLESTDQITTESLFTYVAISVEQEPIEVPDLSITTTQEERLQQKAISKVDGEDAS